MFRSRFCKIRKIYNITLIQSSKNYGRFFQIPVQLISISGRSIESNEEVVGKNESNHHCGVPWTLLCEYAYKSNLLKLKSAEIRDWLKLYDHHIEMDSIQIRDVNCCGQKYLTYITREQNTNELYQYVVVRGTKNWKNIKTSLKYTVSYNDEFAMHLHSGYGNASHAILNDLKQFIDPMARLRLTGHSYGGIVCCCIASHFQKNEISEIDQVVTFGMPQFSTNANMNQLCNEVPIIQVVHVRDEIAKTDWYRTLNRKVNSESQEKLSLNSNDGKMEGIVYIGEVAEKEETVKSDLTKRFYLNNSSLKKPIVHRMGDYVESIEKHAKGQHGRSGE